MRRIFGHSGVHHLHRVARKRSSPSPLSPPEHPILRRPASASCASEAVRIVHHLGHCYAVAPIAHLREQAFVAHAGQIAARNANVRQLCRPDYPHLNNECDRAFSEGRLRTAGHPNSLGAVAITLTNPEGGLWRSFEGNRQHKVRSFVQPEEPTNPLKPLWVFLARRGAVAPRRVELGAQRGHTVARVRVLRRLSGNP